METEAAESKVKRPTMGGCFMFSDWKRSQGCLAEAPPALLSGPNLRWEITELKDQIPAGSVWSLALCRIERGLSLNCFVQTYADWNPARWIAGANGGCLWISRRAECGKQRKLM